MKSLLYLLLMRLKNQLLSLVKSPGKLLYTLFILAMLIFASLAGGKQATNPSELRDIRELLAGLFALYLLMFVLTAKRGFDAGATLFSQADVNLIFTAPIKPQTVLFFGLIQQMGTSLMLGFFILFQYTWLHQMYGLSMPILCLIILGYAVTVFLAQLTAMVLYCLISSDEKRSVPLKILFYGLLVLYGFWVLSGLLPDPSLLPGSLVALGNHWVTHLFPVAGWVSAILAGAITDSSFMILEGSLLCLIYFGLLVCLVIFTHADYYEDVLQTAESNYSAITAKKEGRSTEAAPKRVRLGRVGLEGGAGASAFYYKHKIENRRSRIFILNGQSLFFIVLVIISSFFMKDAGIWGIFGFSTYIQIINISTNRLSRELTKPYIYLVPEPSMKKLLYCLKESVSGTVLEAILLYIPISLIFHLSFPELLCFIFARITFAFLFMAGNIMVQRVFGASSIKALIFFFYFFSLMVMALPGILLAIFVTLQGIQLISLTVTALLAMSFANIPVALLVFYLCRNMLQYAELSNR